MNLFSLIFKYKLLFIIIIAVSYIEPSNAFIKDKIKVDPNSKEATEAAKVKN